MVFTKETGVVLYAALVATYALCAVLTPGGPTRDLRRVLRAVIPLCIPLAVFATVFTGTISGTRIASKILWLAFALAVAAGDHWPGPSAAAERGVEPCVA